MGRRARALGTALVAGAVTVALIAAAWSVVHPGPLFAWVVHCLLMACAAVVVGAFLGPLPRWWFHVGPREPLVHRAVGVRHYGRLLDLVRWNRTVEAARGFDGTRAGLSALDQHTRRSEVGHLGCLLVTVPFAALVATSGRVGGAVWLLALAVVLHAYPVLLQRSVRARIQAITDR